MSDPGYFDSSRHPDLRHDAVREVRPCKSCGHERSVLVRYGASSDRRDASGRYLWRQTVTFNENCTACEHERQARWYDHLAAKHREKARALRARRSE